MSRFSEGSRAGAKGFFKFCKGEGFANSAEYVMDSLTEEDSIDELESSNDVEEFQDND